MKKKDIRISYFHAWTYVGHLELNTQIQNSTKNELLISNSKLKFTVDPSNHYNTSTLIRVYM